MSMIFALFVLVWTNVGGYEVQYMYINSEVLQ